MLRDPRKICLGKSLDLQPFLNSTEGRLGSKCFSTLTDEITPRVKGCHLSQGPVVRFREAIAIKRLNPTAGLEDPVCLTEELGPVRDGPDYPPEVNKVERAIFSGPYLVEVVDLANVLLRVCEPRHVNFCYSQHDIGRYPLRLDG